MNLTARTGVGFRFTPGLAGIDQIDAEGTFEKESSGEASTNIRRMKTDGMDIGSEEYEPMGEASSFKDVKPSDISKRLNADLLGVRFVESKQQSKNETSFNDHVASNSVSIERTDRYPTRTMDSYNPSNKLTAMEEQSNLQVIEVAKNEMDVEIKRVSKKKVAEMDSHDLQDMNKGSSLSRV